MTNLTAARADMRRLHRLPEPEVLAGLLPAATLSPQNPRRRRQPGAGAAR